MLTVFSYYYNSVQTSDLYNNLVRAVARPKMAVTTIFDFLAAKRNDPPQVTGIDLGIDDDY